MNHRKKLLSTCLLGAAALLAGASPAWAQTAPSLGTASSFAALSGAGLTCTGAAVQGDVGSLLSVTGFPPELLCTLTGTVHAADATATAAHEAAFGANGTYNALAAQACNFQHAATEQLGGQTLQSGVHCFPSDALLNGTLNLVGSGPWILRMGSTLTTGATAPALASVLVNGQANCNGGVFWQIGSSATIGANTRMVGNILAVAAISFTGDNKSLVGRALANVEAVTIGGTNATLAIANCGGTGGSDPSASCPDRVTGGGYIKTSGHHGKANFGLTAGIRNGKARGNLTYIDHGQKGKRDDIKVKSTRVTAYIEIDAKTRRIEGTARMNGESGFTYQVDVTDNGRSGKTDTFAIRVFDAVGALVYSASGTLAGGNIQLHKRDCGKKKKGHDDDDDDDGGKKGKKGHDDDDDDDGGKKRN